jgi:hypothetical protein
MSKRNLLAEAQSKAPDFERKPKGTVWKLESEALGSIAQCQKEAAPHLEQLAKINARLEAAKSQVLSECDQRYLKCLEETGEGPATPIKATNAGGDSVTYIWQDRTANYRLDQQDVKALGKLIGVKSLKEVLSHARTWKLNSKVLEGLSTTQGTAVADAISSAILGLERKKILTKEQVDSFLVYEDRTTLMPGKFSRLIDLTARTPAGIAALVNTLGSSLVRFLKLS